MNDETLVGMVASTLSIIAMVIAAGPWLAPYQLRTMMRIKAHYGKRAARGAWLLIALISGCSGAAILSGLRPSYASPKSQSPTPSSSSVVANGVPPGSRAQ